MLPQYFGYFSVAERKKVQNEYDVFTRSTKEYIVIPKVRDSILSALGKIVLMPVSKFVSIGSYGSYKVGKEGAYVIIKNGKKSDLSLKNIQRPFGKDLCQHAITFSNKRTRLKPYTKMRNS